MVKIVRFIKSAVFYLFMLLLYCTLLAVSSNGKERYRATDIIPVTAQKNILEAFEGLPYNIKIEAKRNKNFEGIKFFSPGTLFERVGGGSIWNNYWLVRPVGYKGEYWAPEEKLANALIVDKSGNYMSFNENREDTRAAREIKKINRQIYLLERRLKELKKED